MNITVAGIGYVGLANAVLLARHNTVTAYDIDRDKRDKLNARISPVRDEEIEEYLRIKDLRLSAEGDKRRAYAGADFVIVAAPTDYDEEKNFFNTAAVEAVLNDAALLAPRATVVIKSTVPVGFTETMGRAHPGMTLLFSPEFLREGRALYDNLYPSRVIVGGPRERAEVFAGLLLEGAVKKDAPVLFMEPTEAEAVKLFANTFLATRVAYFNELDTYAETRGLNAKAIIRGVCLDPRIGDYYNNPSFGYGGYCLPKDTKQLKANYSDSDIDNNLISAVVAANETRKDHVAGMIAAKIDAVSAAKNPGTAGVYRLAMKSDSDNFRYSAVLDIITRLKRRGIAVIIFEPLLKTDVFSGCPVVNDIERFKAESDIIIANRMSGALAGAAAKVYTRDVFSRD